MYAARISGRACCSAPLEHPTVCCDNNNNGVFASNSDRCASNGAFAAARPPSPSSEARVWNGNLQHHTLQSAGNGWQQCTTTTTATTKSESSPPPPSSSLSTCILCRGTYVGMMTHGLCVGKHPNRIWNGALQHRIWTASSSSSQIIAAQPLLTCWKPSPDPTSGSNLPVVVAAVVVVAQHRPAGGPSVVHPNGLRLLFRQDCDVERCYWYARAFTFAIFLKKIVLKHDESSKIPNYSATIRLYTVGDHT